MMRRVISNKNSVNKGLNVTWLATLYPKTDEESLYVSYAPLRAAGLMIERK